MNRNEFKLHLFILGFTQTSQWNHGTLWRKDTIKVTISNYQNEIIIRDVAQSNGINTSNIQTAIRHIEDLLNKRILP